MELQVLITVYATLFIGSPLIALLHETGHAVAYLAFTKPKSIDIYIGSYGDDATYIKFRVGNLNYFIKKSFPFVRGIGLCKSGDAETNYVNSIIISLAGPVFTFMIATIIALMNVATGSQNLFFNIACYVFLGLSLLSLLVNLIPREIKTNNGELSTDGQQILFKLKLKKQLPNYIQGYNYFQEQDYERAVLKYKEVLESVPRELKTIRLLISALAKEKQYSEAQKYLDRLEASTELSNLDLINKGYLQAINKQHHEAIGTLNIILKRDRNNLMALNNISYSLIEQKAFDTATRVLERAIKIKPDFPYPYCNWAYMKLLQDDFEGGKLYIDKAIQLAPEDANSYKILGYYYLKIGKTELAETNFDKAIEIDKNIEIDDFLAELEKLKAQISRADVMDIY